MKGKTKLKFHQNKSNYYDEIDYRGQSNTFKSEEDPSSKYAEGISRIYHEVVLLLKFLRTKPQGKIKNMNFYDLYYTVNKN